MGGDRLIRVEDASDKLTPLIKEYLTNPSPHALVILEAGGLQGGGVNFDAKTRRNSTDLADLFHAHIGGIDVFARALLAADAVLTRSDYSRLRRERYASFDDGEGQLFEAGKLKLGDLSKIARRNGEPALRSGRQELFENILNRFV